MENYYGKQLIKYIVSIMYYFLLRFFFRGPSFVFFGRAARFLDVHLMRNGNSSCRSLRSRNSISFQFTLKCLLYIVRNAMSCLVYIQGFVISFCLKRKQNSPNVQKMFKKNIPRVEDYDYDYKRLQKMKNIN